ncbi:hypothetical protein FALCPG4_015919 [Fusarium falciforme]
MNVRGFRIGEQLLSPLTTLSKSVPIYVTDGPSSYSPDWLEMNMDEPFNDFHDSFVRSAHESNALDVSLRNNQLHIRDTSLNTKTNISLCRTLRLPEDGNEYNLPALFGQFPLINVDFLRKNLPEAIVQKSGVVIPMYQREAISINIDSARHQMHATSRFETPRKPTNEDFAIRVFSGGVNVISGLPVNKTRGTNEQDYITSPAQKRLDGFLSASKGERSIVRQFVSMPTGAGYSAEGQVTGAELISGVQLIIAPPFAGHGQFWLDKHEARPLVMLTAQDESPSSMGFHPGTRLRLSGKEIEKRLKVKQGNHTDEIWYTPGQSFDHYKSRGDSHDMRPLWTHEVLLPILERCEHPETLVMEPVFDMSITIEVNDLSTFPAAQAQQTWTLSPFITRERLYKIIKREFGLGDRLMEVRYPTNSVASGTDPVMLHHVCSNGDVILVSARRPPPVIRSSGARGTPPKQTSPPPPTARVSGWELGLACGGTVYQDVYADVDTKRWNWKKSQLLNIQILNAVAFETFTGFSPPEPPISFTSYLDADIPFYHIMPKSSLLGSEVISKLETASQVDLRTGIFKSAVLQGLKPIECILCDRMLADTILRPCNHVFCGGCIQQNMQFRYEIHCPACKELSSHQIQFAGPMERSHECPSKASTMMNLQRGSQATGLRREVKTSKTKIEEENEIFISSIRQSAMSAIIDDLERAMSQSALSNSSSFEKGKQTIASSLSSILHWKLPDEGKTILQTASEQNRADVVEFLLQTNRQTPANALAALEIAAASGHLDIVKLLVKPALIRQNKSVNNESAGYIALKYGEKSGMSGETKFWLQDESPETGSSITPLHLAAENGHHDVVRLLLDAGLDPNMGSFNRRMDFVGRFSPTPLAWAAKGNHVPVAKMLIPVTKTNFVEEAALYAAHYGSDDVLDLLIDRVGTDVKDCWGRSLIHIVAQSGRLSAGKTINMLLKYGVDANTTWG